LLRKIFLHGSLRVIHPDPITVVADTVAEAIKAISVQLPGFRPNPLTGYKKIKIAGYDTAESLFIADKREEIHIFPQFCGGKQGGFIQIAIGALLVAASFAMTATGFGAAFAPLLLKIGALLIIGGLLQLMSAPARDKKDGAANKSYYLGTPKNTVEIGTRIPILYGRRRVGGHYLSFNISSVDTGI
jgi:predicted phage tail protein